MPRMLDLIRNSEVPSTLMHSASHGSLAVPPEETLEILVYLALHNKLFGEQARLTLAGWDEMASLVAASDPKTSIDVLGYFSSQENLRPALLPALAENPSVSEESLDRLATSGSRAIADVLLASSRVMNSRRLMEALKSNPILRPNEVAELAARLAALELHVAEDPAEPGAPDEVVESAVMKFLEENAAEVEAENDKPFQPMGITQNEIEREMPPEAADHGAPEAEESATAAVAEPSPAPAGPARKAAPVQGDRRDSTLQKIAKLDIKGRIALAMRGNKEERSILIRDSTKLIPLAVLDSPKLTDAEVEKFALQKNVLESVLRTIPMKRKFAKNYTIMRNLVYNPRTPLDASLGLMKGLLLRDLKNLTDNKEVSDTIRKVAMRMYRQKHEKKG